MLTQASSHSRSEVSASRRALAGFFLSGVILSFPGAILPAWGYHLRPNYLGIGNYFLAVAAGLLLSARLAGRVLRTRGSAATLLFASAAISLALLYLGQTGPPVPEIWRFPGLIALGTGAGVLNTAVFQSLSPAYRLNPAATVNLAGIFFGLGCSLSPLLLAGTFNLYSVNAVLVAMALVPAAFTVLYRRLPASSADAASSQRSVGRLPGDFTMPAAVLLSLLLFFHFGNEWAIAGWLPLYLILRLGVSPATALLLLGAYWLALMFGRIAVQAILPRVSHPKLLLYSVVAALFGCLVLGLTDNLFGAVLGTLFIGGGFAPIYPLVVERIRSRFPEYHPGFFNGIFSMAVAGGMLAPAMLGYVVAQAGLGAVTFLPVIGTIVVLVLVLVIWLEAWFTRSHSPEADGERR